jgi:hypothetical protein
MLKVSRICCDAIRTVLASAMVGESTEFGSTYQVMRRRVCGVND